MKYTRSLISFEPSAMIFDSIANVEWHMLPNWIESLFGRKPERIIKQYIGRNQWWKTFPDFHDCGHEFRFWLMREYEKKQYERLSGKPL